jgi:hypothetical protein
MVVPGHEKIECLHAMAADLRHAADETNWPRYQVRLLQVARDLEREAAKLDDQHTPESTSGDASRAG